MIGNHYEIVVIPVDVAVAANLDADKEDSGKTSKTFTVGLSPTGKLPITHLWCSWWMNDEKATRLKKDFNGTPDTVAGKHSSRVFDSRQGHDAEKILQKVGLKRIEIDMPTRG
jgi:hypothetical protein